jgi:hypothetical protein
MADTVSSTGMASMAAFHPKPAANVVSAFDRLRAQAL